MRVSAVWACVRLIAETIATLPLGVYRRLPDGSREADTSNPLYTVLSVSPNEHMSPVQFWEAMVASMLLRGEEDVDGMVAGAPIHTDNHPILEFSDMDLSTQVDVAPNLGQLLGYQKENLGGYFTGSNRQLATLRRHFNDYRHNYWNYVRAYETAAQ